MKWVREIGSWILVAVVAVGISLLFTRFVMTSVRVSGPSMEPNLTNNERVFASRLSKLKHNSVIVFDAYGEDPGATKPGDNYVKRVIGLPGDTVESKNGYIYINGKKTSEDYISKDERTSGTGNWTLKSIANRNDWSIKGNKVPAGHYFVLGDHRSVSNDSRYWGFVDKDKVMGVVKVPFWSGNKTTRHNINKLAY